MNCFDEQFMNTVHELAWWTIDECSWMLMNIHQRSSLDELHLTGATPQFVFQTKAHLRGNIVNW